MIYIEIVWLGELVCLLARKELSNFTTETYLE